VVRPMSWTAAVGAASVLAALLVVGTGCGDGGGDDDAAARVDVVASLDLFADLARNVGGDRVEVRALLPPGADPHTFELSPGRVADVAGADLVFINGLGLEESIEDIVTTNAGGPVVELAEGLAAIDDNPHLWLDVQNAMRYVERIRDALIEVDQAGAGEYEANASAYREELAALDAEVEAAIAGIPEANRKLVTFHDAFPYLASRYGLEVVAVVVPSPGQEPSARAIAELTETLADTGVPAAFAEPQFDSATLDQAAAGAGVRVLDLLSDAFTDEVASYVELMRYNVAQLVEGLGGD